MKTIAFLGLSLCCVAVPTENENSNTCTSSSVERVFFPDVDKALQASCPPTFSALDIPRLKKKANEGDALAQAQLGVIYAEGKIVAQDVSKAFDYFSRSAEQDCAMGLNGLGLCYNFGWCVPKDYSRAFSLIKKSAEKGYANAQLGLGTFFANGLGPIKKNMKEAFFWYGHAAEQGNDVAQAALASCYYTGAGCNPSKDLAFKWMFLAARQQTDRKYQHAALLIYDSFEDDIEMFGAWKVALISWLKRISDTGELKAKEILEKLETKSIEQK